MPKTKAQKSAILKSLTQKVEQMKSAVFISFNKISVKEIDALRNKCKDEGSQYIVAKKTLLKKSFENQGLGSIDEAVTGEVGAIFGFEDEIAPAKIASAFVKDHQDAVISGGFLDGLAIDKDKVVALSKLPSRQELLAKAVGSIASPLSGFVNVLQGNLRNLVYVLGAVKEKKSNN